MDAKQIKEIRSDFPMLSRRIYDNLPLVYFDNAATTLKPQKVIDSLVSYYHDFSANIHRGAHYIGDVATERFEETRTLIQKFINANSEREIIFTKGTTESFNLLASTLSRSRFLQEGDEVVISQMEHHANMVPWQQLKKEKNIVLKYIPLKESGELDLSQLENLITSKTKLVSVSMISNALGTINDIETIIKQAKKQNALVAIDAAQAVLHFPIDVQKLGVDFLCFSGHKMLGPTGVGILYGKEKILNELPPYQTGGEMILKVTLEESTFNELPFKFEAGTPAIAEVIALGEAVKYINAIGLSSIAEREEILLKKITSELKKIPSLKIIGDNTSKTSIASFVIDKIHPHDVGTFMDRQGMAIRTGHHCAAPIMQYFNVPATSRASLSFYNTEEEIDSFILALKKTVEFFA